jgi:hypothetical protein
MAYDIKFNVAVSGKDSLAQIPQVMDQLSKSTKASSADLHQFEQILRTDIATGRSYRDALEFIARSGTAVSQSTRAIARDALLLQRQYDRTATEAKKAADREAAEAKKSADHQIAEMRRIADEKKKAAAEASALAAETNATHAERLTGVLGAAGLGGVGGLAGGIIAGGIGIEFISQLKEALVGLVESYTEAAEGTVHLAQRLDITAAEAKKLQIEARLAGVSIESLESAARIVAVALEDSEGAGKKAAAAFKRMGIDIHGAFGEIREAGPVTLELIEKLASMENHTARTREAYATLGKGAARELIPMIDKLHELEQVALDMGIKFDSGVIQKAAEGEDAFRRLSLAFDLMKRQLAQKIEPITIDVIRRITDAFADKPQTTTGKILKGTGNAVAWTAQHGWQLTGALLTGFRNNEPDPREAFAEHFKKFNDEGKAKQKQREEEAEKERQGQNVKANDAAILGVQDRSLDARIAAAKEALSKTITEAKADKNNDYSAEIKKAGALVSDLEAQKKGLEFSKERGRIDAALREEANKAEAKQLGGLQQINQEIDAAEQKLREELDLRSKGAALTEKELDYFERIRKARTEQYNLELGIQQAQQRRATANAAIDQSRHLDKARSSGEAEVAIALGRSNDQDEAGIERAFQARMAEAQDAFKDAARQVDELRKQKADLVALRPGDSKAISKLDTDILQAQIKASGDAATAVYDAQIKKVLELIALDKKRWQEAEADAKAARTVTDTLTKADVEDRKAELRRKSELIAAQADSGPGHELDTFRRQLDLRRQAAQLDRDERKRSLEAEIADQERLKNAPGADRKAIEREISLLRAQELSNQRDYERELGDERIEIELRIAEIRKKSEEEYKQFVVGLVNAGLTGGHAVSDYLRQFGHKIFDQVVSNVAGLTFESAKKLLPKIPGQTDKDGNPTVLGKILAGTPFGDQEGEEKRARRDLIRAQQEAKTSVDANTEALRENTREHRRHARPGEAEEDGADAAPVAHPHTDPASDPAVQAARELERVRRALETGVFTGQDKQNPFIWHFADQKPANPNNSRFGVEFGARKTPDNLGPLPGIITGNTAATDRNTAALDRNTAAIQAQRPGASAPAAGGGVSSAIQAVQALSNPSSNPGVFSNIPSIPAASKPINGSTFGSSFEPVTYNPQAPAQDAAPKMGPDIAQNIVAPAAPVSPTSLSSSPELPAAVPLNKLFLRYARLPNSDEGPALGPVVEGGKIPASSAGSSLGSVGDIGIDVVPSPMRKAVSAIEKDAANNPGLGSFGLGIPESKTELALTAASVLPFGKVLKGAKGVARLAGEAVESAPREPWQVPKSELVPYKETVPQPRYTPDTSGGYSEAEIHERSLRNRAAETEPPIVKQFPTGSWGTDSTGELMQLREYRLDDPKLIFPEWLPSSGHPTVQKYSEWMRAGSEPPPLTGLETEKGNIKIQEGHHRAAAIKANDGETVKVWTTITHNRPLGNGQVMPEGVTHAQSVSRALEAGKPVPAEVLADYPELQPKTQQVSKPTAQTDFQSKTEYAGPMQKVPFPLHDWRKDPIVPGVDRDYSIAHGKRTRVALSDLNATQREVRQIDLEHQTTEDFPPVVVKKNEKLWIQDGHHRLTQSFLKGETEAEVLVVDKDKPTAQRSPAASTTPGIITGVTGATLLGGAAASNSQANPIPVQITGSSPTSPLNPVPVILQQGTEPGKPTQTTDTKGQLTRSIDQLRQSISTTPQVFSGQDKQNPLIFHYGRTPGSSPGEPGGAKTPPASNDTDIVSGLTLNSTATDRNTEALDRNTRALEALRASAMSQSGGGGSASGASPSGAGVIQAIVGGISAAAGGFGGGGLGDSGGGGFSFSSQMGYGLDLAKPVSPRTVASSASELTAASNLINRVNSATQGLPAAGWMPQPISTASSAASNTVSSSSTIDWARPSILRDSPNFSPLPVEKTSRTMDEWTERPSILRDSPNYSPLPAAGAITKQSVPYYGGLSGILSGMSQHTGDLPGIFTGIGSNPGGGAQSLTGAERLGAGIGTAGVVAGGIFGAYKGFSSGGAKGGLSGTSSILGTAAMLDPEPISKAILGIGAAVTGVISSLMGDPRAEREKAINKELADNQYLAPEVLNISQDMHGHFTDTDQFGKVRSSPFRSTPQVSEPYLYFHGSDYVAAVPGNVTAPFTQSPAPAAPAPTIVNNYNAPIVNGGLSAIDTQSGVDFLSKHTDAIASGMVGHLRTSDTALAQQIRFLTSN